MKSKNAWLDGTVCIATLMERFAKGETLTITRDEVEKLDFGTTHPVMFEMVDENTIRLRVDRPGGETKGGSDAP
jgi:hypothetical protein